MKKRYILGAVGLVLLGLGTSACSSKADNSRNDQSTSKKTAQLEKNLIKQIKMLKNNLQNKLIIYL